MSRAETIDIDVQACWHRVDAVLGCLLLAFLAYGRNQLKQAETYLRHAWRIALRPDGLANMDSANPLDMLSWQLCDVTLKRLARRVWWELYIASSMMSHTTSGRIPNLAKECEDQRQCKVHFPPSDLPSWDAGDSITSIRVEVVRCLTECVQHAVDHTTGVPDIVRLDALDCIVSNLQTRVELEWSRLSKDSVVCTQNTRQASAAICLFDAATLAHV